MPFAFSYAVDLGRDCFMMGDCGYRLILSAEGVLRRLDDQGVETASTTLSAQERAALLQHLEREGFFTLPTRLPVVPEGEAMLGGRVITMTFESASRSHQVEAIPDDQRAPMPEAFYRLDEAIRTSLLELLGE